MTSYDDLLNAVAALIKDRRTLKVGVVSVVYGVNPRYNFGVKNGCNKTLCSTHQAAAKYFVRLAGRSAAEKAVADIAAADQEAEWKTQDAEAASEKAAEAAMSAHSLGVSSEPLTPEEESDLRRCEEDYAERPAAPTGPAKSNVKWYVNQPWARPGRKPLTQKDTADE